MADVYASDLLLPRFLLEPTLRDLTKPTLKGLREIAAKFQTSLTATIIKVIETDRYPMMIICHGQGGRRWFRGSASVPTRWFPKQDLDPDTFAFGSLFGAAAEEPFPRKIGADAWFDRRGAEGCEVMEQSFALPNSEIATLLFFADPDMLDD